jgi:hypothetical protein
MGTLKIPVVGNGFYCMTAAAMGALSAIYFEGSRCTVTHKYDPDSDNGADNTR